MAVCGGDFQIQTKGESHILDITGQVARSVSESGMRQGMACIFVAGSTGAITTLEFEPGLLEDMPVALERLAPADGEYQHHLRWRDGNGHSHVRAAILGPGITVPFRDGSLLLGMWQQIVFIEMDVRPRARTIHVQLLGD